MSETRDFLWDSFVIEVEAVMGDAAVMFAKPEFEAGELEVLFRSFHNVKSNAKLLGFDQLSRISALGEEICKVLISDGAQNHPEIYASLRDVYQHAYACFECIKTVKAEPEGAGPDVARIKQLLYGGDHPLDQKPYSAAELKMFANILACHLINSLSVPDKKNKKQVKDSIAFIREAAVLMDFHVLAKLYQELDMARNLEKNSADVMEIIRRISVELSNIKADTGMAFHYE